MDASGCSHNNEKDAVLPVIYLLLDVKPNTFRVLNREVIYENLFQVPACSHPRAIASAFSFHAGKRK
jgi:hypothetical protein